MRSLKFLRELGWQWGHDFWNSPVTRMFLPTKEVEKCAMTSAAVLEASRAVAGAEEACGTNAGGE